jgi:hypothetical protein
MTHKNHDNRFVFFSDLPFEEQDSICEELEKRLAAYIQSPSCSDELFEIVYEHDARTPIARFVDLFRRKREMLANKLGVSVQTVEGWLKHRDGGLSLYYDEWLFEFLKKRDIRKSSVKKWMRSKALLGDTGLS